MRIRLSQLRRIIKEEVKRTLHEGGSDYETNRAAVAAVYQKWTSNPEYGGCYLEDFEGLGLDKDDLRTDTNFTSDYKIIGDRVVANSDFKEDTRYPDDRQPLGRIAFAEYRKDVPEPREINTEIESELAIALYHHFNNNVPLNIDFSALLEELLDKGWYSDVINEPRPKIILHRGMLGMTPEWIFNITGIPLDQILQQGMELKGGEWEGEFDYSPRHPGSSSWTDDFNKAKEFAGSSTGRLSVVIEAEADNNPHKFISCKDGLYKVDKFATFAKEREFIGLGTIKCHYLKWWSPSF
jgi:hypothetical protein